MDHVGTREPKSSFDSPLEICIRFSLASHQKVYLCIHTYYKYHIDGDAGWILLTYSVI